MNAIAFGAELVSSQSNQSSAHRPANPSMNVIWRKGRSPKKSSRGMARKVFLENPGHTLLDRRIQRSEAKRLLKEVACLLTD